MDLSTKYLGLDLKHPLVASASPLSKTLDGIRSLEDAGASAIVLFSLFEEQIRFENDSFDFLTSFGADSTAESQSYFPAISDYEVGPDSYLQLIQRAVETTSVPIIGSLNGVTSTGWVDYAKQIEQAGAHALELNVYYIPSEMAVSGREVEERYLHIARTVRAAVKIPIAMKLSPFFSSMGEMARLFCEIGVDGLVLFNRFYQPDFDLETLSVEPSIQLSSPHEIRLPLLWTAILRGRVSCSLGATTGVHSGRDAAKYILAGADVAMMTSALLKNGAPHLTRVLTEFTGIMSRHGYASVEQMKGAMSQAKVSDPAAFERANYVKSLQSFKPAYQ